MRHRHRACLSRRSVLAGAFAGLGAVLSRAEIAAEEKKGAPIPRKDPLKITKLETFLVQPRWLFLKVHTNAGIVAQYLSVVRIPLAPLLANYALGTPATFTGYNLLMLLL